MLGSGIARPSTATEPLVVEITKSTLEGEWEGAWRDKVAGRLIVFYLRIISSGQSVMTVVHGPLPNPFLEPFELSTIECMGGRVELKGAGVGDANGETLAITGSGWALQEDGFLDVSVRKVSKSGRVLTFEVRFNKLEGGFFKNADRLVQVAKKRSLRNTKGN
jgi:hypothetical protein